MITNVLLQEDGLREIDIDQHLVAENHIVMIAAIGIKEIGIQVQEGKRRKRIVIVFPPENEICQINRKMVNLSKGR
jgi:hypothetical protein